MKTHLVSWDPEPQRWRTAERPVVQGCSSCLASGPWAAAASSDAAVSVPSTEVITRTSGRNFEATTPGPELVSRNTGTTRTTRSKPAIGTDSPEAPWHTGVSLMVAAAAAGGCGDCTAGGSRDCRWAWREATGTWRRRPDSRVRLNRVLESGLNPDQFLARSSVCASSFGGLAVLEFNDTREIEIFEQLKYLFKKLYAIALRKKVEVKWIARSSN